MDLQVLISSLLLLLTSGEVEGEVIQTKIPLSSTTCPEGFIRVPGSTSCYLFTAQRLDYDQSYKQCTKQSQHAGLAAVESYKEHRSIRAYLIGNPVFNDAPCNGWYWIGGERPDRNKCSSPFFWKKRNGNSTYNEPVSFTAWGPGEPSCHKNSLGCIHYMIGHYYLWNDQGCSTKLCAICEAPTVSNPVSVL